MKTLIFVIGLLMGLGMTSTIVWFSFKPVCNSYQTYQKTSEIVKNIPFLGGDK